MNMPTAEEAFETLLNNLRRFEAQAKIASLTETLAVPVLEALAKRTFKLRAADLLADEVAVLVRRRVIDALSPAADAVLSYRDPPETETSKRIADLERQNEGLVERVVELERELARKERGLPKK